MGTDDMDPFNVVGAIFAGSKIVCDIILFWKDSSTAPEEASQFGPLFILSPQETLYLN